MFFNNKFNTFFGLNLTLVYKLPMCMACRFHFPIRKYDFKFNIPDEPTNSLYTCVFRQLYFLFIPLLRCTSSTLWFRYRYRFVYVVHFISLNIHKLIMCHMIVLTKLIGHIYSWVLFLLERGTWEHFPHHKGTEQNSHSSIARLRDIYPGK